MVFKQFDTHPGRVGDVPYSQFMADARDGRIDSVSVEGRVLKARTSDCRQILSYAPPDCWMVSDLLKYGVEVKAKPEEEQSLLYSIFGSWFPMLLLIGVWVFFMRQM